MDSTAVTMDRLRLVLAWTVAGLWVSTIITASFLRDFRFDPSLQAVMLIVAGYLFGPSIVGRRKNNHR